MRICASGSATQGGRAFNVGQSFVERNRLAAGRKLRELCLDDVVGKVGDIVEAFPKTRITSSDWRKIGSMESAHEIGSGQVARPQQTRSERVRQGSVESPCERCS